MILIFVFKKIVVFYPCLAQLLGEELVVVVVDEVARQIALGEPAGPSLGKMFTYFQFHMLLLRQATQGTLIFF